MAVRPELTSLESRQTDLECCQCTAKFSVLGLKAFDLVLEFLVQTLDGGKRYATDIVAQNIGLGLSPALRLMAADRDRITRALDLAQDGARVVAQLPLVDGSHVPVRSSYESLT